MNLFEALLAGKIAGGSAPEPTLVEKSITANGTYSASDDSADGYSAVSVSVPNSYTAGDEGKVVSNGALVSQGSDTATQNGTVDTTLINSLTVNVSGGAEIVKLQPVWSYITSSDVYIVESDSYIYVFGLYEDSSGSSSGVILFSIPETFDLSKLGNSSSQCGVRYRKSNGSSAALSAMINTTNRSFAVNSSYSGESVIIAVFSKAT